MLSAANGTSEVGRERMVWLGQKASLILTVAGGIVEAVASDPWRIKL